MRSGNKEWKNDIKVTFQYATKQKWYGKTQATSHKLQVTSY